MACELGFLASKQEIGNERHKEQKVYPPRMCEGLKFPKPSSLAALVAAT